MKYIATIFPLLFPFAVLAQPSVNDGTISVPADGWYQFQRADTYETLCEGVLLCAVPVGSYNVINHTTGERFTDIAVSSSESEEPTDSDSVIQVNGNTLSWPDNGWYQVQTMTDYSTVCEGSLSCDVASGSYIVINHSTGERYENIEVGGTDSTPDPVTAVSVEGNVISWPDDGWYQVQDANDYTTVCEGGNSCEVPSGTYTVINHASGERFENISVSGSSTDTPTLTPTPNNVVIAGVPYKISRVWLNSVVTGKNLYTGNTFDTYFAFALNSSFIDGLVEGTTMACTGGGTVRYERQVDSLGSGVASFSSASDIYNYNNCVLSGGEVDGRITVTDFQTLSERTLTTDFNVSTSQSSFDAILTGQKVDKNSTYSIFNPVCGSTSNTSSSTVMLLNNSTVNEMTESGLETHYYANLNHREDEETNTDCAGEHSYIQYASSANYTHTSGSRVSTVEVSKSGVVGTTVEAYESARLPSIAKLSATINTPEDTIVNMTIAASDQLGRTLDVSISDEFLSVEFSEEVDFRDVSDL